jgi:hypothetical protein
MLTPFIPLSNGFIENAQYLICLKGGKNRRGGFAPSLLNSPLQPKIAVIIRRCLRLERGHRGEVYIKSQIPTKPYHRGMIGLSKA